MYSNILVPLDVSELAEKALPHAISLAKNESATLHLVHVFTSHPSMMVSTGGLSEDINPAQAADIGRQLEEANIQQAQSYLDRVASRARGDGVKTETALLEGSPHEELAKYAKENGVGAVVICTHGRGGLQRMLIGSVADKLIRSGEVPVMVIPALSYRTEPA